MHWDINDLENKLKQLKFYSTQTNNENEYLTLRYDILAIKYIINCFYKRNQKLDYIKDYNAIFKILHDKKRDFDLKSYLDKNLENLVLKSSFKVDGLKVKRHLFMKHNIKIDEYLELVTNFLYKYDKNLYNIFLNMKSSHSIETTNNFNIKSAKGFNVHLCSDGSNYIYSKYINDIDYFSVLVHELAHAYQHEKLCDLQLHINKSNSIFREAYPIFIEYVFSDYLMKSNVEKYTKLGYELESVLLDNFVLTTEHISSLITSAKEEKNNFNYFKNKIITLFYSDLLAFYFFDKYLRNDENIKSNLYTFNKEYGVKNDCEILEKYNNFILQKSLSNILNKYYSR